MPDPWLTRLSTRASNLALECALFVLCLRFLRSCSLVPNSRLQTLDEYQLRLSLSKDLGQAGYVKTFVLRHCCAASVSCVERTLILGAGIESTTRAEAVLSVLTVACPSCS